MKFITSSLFFLAIFLVGCSETQRTESTISAQIQTTPTGKLTQPSFQPIYPHPEVSTQATQLDESPTRPFPTDIDQTIIIPTPTETSLIPPPFIDNCIPVYPEIPAIADVSGLILFDQYLLDPSSKQIWQPQKEEMVNSVVTISPDRRKLAFLERDAESGEFREKWLVIVNAKGEELSRYELPIAQWEKTYSGISLYRWLNNEQVILIGLIINSNTYNLIIVSIVSGELEELPDASYLALPMYPSLPFLDYFSSLNSIVFTATSPDISFWAEYAFIVQDSKSHNILSEIGGNISNPNVPSWTTDGEEFVIASPVILIDGKEKSFNGSEELFSVTQAGELTQLTNYSQYFTQKKGAINITAYAWSPNQQYIGMWVRLKTDMQTKFTFVLLDTQTKLSMDFCLTTESNRDFRDTPIWSPDSTKILLSIHDPEDENTSRVILVDIANDYAAVLADNVEPVGWMVAP